MGDDADNQKAIAQGSMQGMVEGAMKPFNDLLQALFGPSAEEAGLLLRDYVRTFRIEKQVQLMDRLNKVLGRAGVRPSRVPVKVLGPIFEGATLEDDDDLQETWANMLANAANPATPDAVVSAFPAMLKDLRPVDVKFLATLYEESYLKRLNSQTVENSDAPLVHHKTLSYAMKQTGLRLQDKYDRKTERSLYLAALETDARELSFVMDMLLR